MTTAVLTLADFLRSRLDDDLVDFRGAHYLGLSCARVRADVRAKRQVVRLHEDCGTGSGCCDDGDGGDEGLGCTTLAFLAMPYAGHPDYRPEWRP